MGSTKRVKLHGTFTAKAGLDLGQDLNVDIRPDQIVIKLPHAQILDVAQDQVDVLAFDNGFWNRISGDDVQSELSLLPQLAREKPAETVLSSEAEPPLQNQLTEPLTTPHPPPLLSTPT